MIQCKNCGAEYIGETGRLLKTLLDKHRKDVDNTNNEKFVVVILFQEFIPTVYIVSVKTVQNWVTL